jgi:acid stress-induced BolA-like protein IbaG/YrbA
MALQIVNQGPPPEVIVEQIREAIAAAVDGAEITIDPRGPGHFEIAVVSGAFEGKSRVQQQQLVYGAITELMSGPNAPVHAIDKLECRSA